MTESEKLEAIRAKITELKMRAQSLIPLPSKTLTSKSQSMSLEEKEEFKKFKEMKKQGTLE